MAGPNTLGWYNVKDYGAVGDGTTDDTNAINSAVTAAGINGTVYFPPGTFLIGSSTATPPPHRSFRGPAPYRLRHG